MKKIYFENLNGLRFIAFLAIFLNHGIFTYDKIVKDSSSYHIIKILLKPASLGVSFFFCLSGFLITHLLLVEIQNYSKIFIGKFYIRRILRIWPLYYAVVLFGFFIFPYLRSYFIAEPYTETATLWKYLFFLSNFDMIEKWLPYGVGLGVTWSLSVEEQFYLAWPLLLSIVNRKYYIHLTIFLFVFGNVLLSFFDFNYLHTLGSMVDLSIGAFLALICYKRNKLFSLLIKFNRNTILLIYLAGFIHIYTWTLWGLGHIIFNSLFMAFVVFEQSYSRFSFFKMAKFRAISYLGTLTYGFYLLHPICNFIIYHFIMIFRSKIALPIFTDLLLQPVLSLIFTLILGYFSYNYFEKFFLDLKLKFAPIDTSPNK